MTTPTDSKPKRKRATAPTAQREALRPVNVRIVRRTTGRTYATTVDYYDTKTDGTVRWLVQVPAGLSYIGPHDDVAFDRLPAGSALCVHDG